MNVLYLYTKKFFGNTQVALLRYTREHNAYYLHQLPRVAFKFQKDNLVLQLTEQHLSIHQKDDVDNPHLSAYHYTACFNHHEYSFKLHVYFGRKDEVTDVHLAQTTGSDTRRIALSEQEANALIAHAQSQSAPFIRSCRAKANEQIKADESTLNKLITTVDYPHRNAQYYRNIIAHLRNILSYYPEKEYRHKFICFQKMYKLTSSTPNTGINPAIQTNPQSPKTKERAKTVPLQNEPLSLAEETDIPTPKSKPRSPKAKAKVQLRPLIDELQATATQYQQKFDTDVLARKIPELCEFYRQTYEVSALADENTYLMTVEDAIELDKLISDNEHKRIEYFKQLFVNERFDDSLALLGADKDIGASLLSTLVHYALRTNNAPKLDFLLTNFEYPINTSEFDSMSPALFCFKKSETTADIAHCFRILVKHGINLSETIPGTSQSILERIYSEPQNPLCRIINRGSTPHAIARLEEKIAQEEMIAERKNKKSPQQSIRKLSKSLKLFDSQLKNLSEQLTALTAILSSKKPTQTPGSEESPTP